MLIYRKGIFVTDDHFKQALSLIKSMSSRQSNLISLKSFEMLKSKQQIRCKVFIGQPDSNQQLAKQLVFSFFQYSFLTITPSLFYSILQILSFLSYSCFQKIKEENLLKKRNKNSLHLKIFISHLFVDSFALVALLLIK